MLQGKILCIMVFAIYSPGDEKKLSSRLLSDSLVPSKAMRNGALEDRVDFFRLDANRKLEPQRKSDLGQFMTPPATARLMASMFEAQGQEISLLDAGAGVGSLTAAFVSEIRSRSRRPKAIAATAYEVDSSLAEYLSATLAQCRSTCRASGVRFEAKLMLRDFIEDGARMLREEMFAVAPRFNCAILNPPYKKINSDSEVRRVLREVGVETSNLYTGFLSVVLMLMAPGGELVAITPRSFCNGPYFKPFRKLLLDTLALRRIHVFESRHVLFREDDVLQENVIFHGVKDSGTRGEVTISSSIRPDDESVTQRRVPYRQVVRPGDPEYFIHIVPDELGASVARRMGDLNSTLSDLDIDVSTGRVVDFRATALLRGQPAEDTVPLIYPRNCENGVVRWPKTNGKKPQALALLPGAAELLVPKGTYVLVKRFSAKEETRRVVAAVYDPTLVTAERVGFENHLNYYHRRGSGLPGNLARGLAVFLNTTAVDLYFRQFNGHTQVNATDLRNLKYPTEAQLSALGSTVGEDFPGQDRIDELVDKEIFNLVTPQDVTQPAKTGKKVAEALRILKELGLPREQQNERSALTLLSLVDLRPSTSWSKAKAPLMGITPMMDFFSKHYGKQYAPNTRETVRRQTIHQFLQAGMVKINPDDPSRATNSPKAVYQIQSGLQELLRTHGTAGWKRELKKYLDSSETLRATYAQARQLERIPVHVSSGKKITLSPGGQNVLIERVIKDFCEYFAQGGIVLYVGDTDQKWAHFDERPLKSLGVTVDAHGKMPDVIVYLKKKNWLVLIEAVTSHGPVNPKRRDELRKLFKNSKAGLVFVTAFLDRRAMMKYLNEISWETEVWVADAPTHLIHFDGKRFLGPYAD